MRALLEPCRTDSGAAALAGLLLLERCHRVLVRVRPRAQAANAYPALGEALAATEFALPGGAPPFRRSVASGAVSAVRPAVRAGDALSIAL